MIIINVTPTAITGALLTLSIRFFYGIYNLGTAGGLIPACFSHLQKK